MFYHVTGIKHTRNFLIKQYPSDHRIVFMTRTDVLTKAVEWEEENFSEGERDYRVILQVEDYEKYCQLRNRPRDWSEKKESLGLYVNTNMAREILVDILEQFEKEVPENTETLQMTKEEACP